MLEYLHANGFDTAYDALKTDTGTEYTPDPKARYAGLLEKKWTSVIRLQKKVRLLLSLETPSSYVDPWVDHGFREQKCRIARRDLTFASKACCISNRLGSSRTSSSCSYRPSIAHNGCRIPSSILAFSLFERGCYCQDLGLGNRRTGTHSERTYEGHPGCRFRSQGQSVRCVYCDNILGRILKLRLKLHVHLICSSRYGTRRTNGKM